jgi:hypothetical protein
MNINVDVDVMVTVAVLLDDTRYMYDFLLHHWNWDIHKLLYRLMHNALLWNDFGDMDNLLSLVRHVNVDMDVNVMMALTLLLNNLGNMDNLLLLMGNVDIDMNVNMMVVVSFVLYDPWHVDNLFHLHGHRDIYDLLDGLVMDTLLRYDPRHVHNLVNDMLDRSMDDLRHFLHHLIHLDFGDLLNLDHFVNGWDLHNVLLCLPGYKLFLMFFSVHGMPFYSLCLPCDILGRSNFLLVLRRRMVNLMHCSFVVPGVNTPTMDLMSASHDMWMLRSATGADGAE